VCSSDLQTGNINARRLKLFDYNIIIVLYEIVIASFFSDNVHKIKGEWGRFFLVRWFISENIGQIRTKFCNLVEGGDRL
jgi:hypothetical protein